MLRPAYLLNLPETPFQQAHAFQTAANAARHCGLLDRDLVIMLEHPPVFTLGRRGGRQNLIVPEEILRARKIEILPVERGGDITYHGPGQVVVYLILDLNANRLSVVDFVTGLETAMVRTAADWGVSATGKNDFRGAWVGRRKLGSVGITVRRGVTFHGLAMNANTDLEPFSWINPCGIQGCAMTSLAEELGHSVDSGKVRRQLAEHLAGRFRLSWQELDIETAKSLIENSQNSPIQI